MCVGLLPFVMAITKLVSAADDGFCHDSQIDDFHLKSNGLSSLVQQDEIRIAEVLEPIDEFLSEAQIRDRFYRLTSSPVQTACTVTKRFGGEWRPGCGFHDGDKIVCMDHLIRDITKGECLIYSFGVADDWSFEDAMGELGCKVRAFDPTVDFPRERSANVSFERTGLAHFNGKTRVLLSHKKNEKMVVPVKTLDKIVAERNDQNKEISFLKVDVEGSELLALAGWIESGVIKNIRQIGIEFHTGPVHLEPQRTAHVLKELIRAIQKMYKIGFRLIAYNPNGCMGKSWDRLTHKYYTYFDAVFYKLDFTSNSI